MVFKISDLEAQQRYFSCRTVLVAIVWPKYFMLVFYGVLRNKLHNEVSHTCACVKLRAKWGYRTILEGELTSL